MKLSMNLVRGKIGMMVYGHLGKDGTIVSEPGQLGAIMILGRIIILTVTEHREGLSQGLHSCSASLPVSQSSHPYNRTSKGSEFVEALSN